MIDFVASGFELSGLYVIGNKRRYGFILCLLGDLVWIYVGWKAHLYGLIGIAIIALVFNVRNYLKWRREFSDSKS